VHTITTRLPTPEEQQIIAEGMKPDYASYGCLVVFAVGAAWMFGILGHWLGSFVSEDVSTYAKWVGWCAGAALTIPILVEIIPYDRKQRQLTSRDHDSQVVQDIHVTNPRVVEIALINNNAPILALDIGEDTILFLQGQWLINHEIYGAEIPPGDEGDEMINGLPSPHSFPCTKFTITRLPNSGVVFRIQVAGEYLAPESVVDALKPEYRFQDSEIFKGSLDNITGVLALEHAAKTAS